MSIAEKILTVVKNQRKLYDVIQIGKENLAQRGVQLTEKPTTYDIMRGISEIPACSNALEYVTNLNGMYQNFKFPTGYEIILDIPRSDYLVDLFHNATGVKKITIKGNINEQPLNVNNAFWFCTDVEIIDISDLSFTISYANNLFSNAHNLREIIGYIDLRYIRSANYAFEACNSLVEVRFLPNNIPGSLSFVNSNKLSQESIQSIIDGLIDLSNAGYQQNITFSGIIASNLTAEQILQITNKNWVIQ